VCRRFEIMEPIELNSGTRTSQAVGGVIRRSFYICTTKGVVQVVQVLSTTTYTSVKLFILLSSVRPDWVGERRPNLLLLCYNYLLF
jgi:hypothetical protein